VNRPILSLWPYLWRAFVALPAALTLAALGVVSAALIAVAAALLLLGAWQFRWLWRFAQRVRRFRTMTDGRVVLHYEPGLERRRDLRLLMRDCRADLDQLARQFKFTLRRTPVVYLFHSYRDIASIFGPEYGGTALSAATAIVVADDNALSESVRHELVHLFAARWGLAAPPLLDEGLAVWLQETDRGQPIDAAARPWLCEPGLKLRSLLSRRFFFAEPQRYACYLLAGSFTGFLVRRYGWPAYRKLFRMSDGTRFEAKFEKCFAISLDEAERQWRYETLARSPSLRRAGNAVCT
jgi:hypothetical protein